MKLNKLFEDILKESQLFLEDVTQESCDCCKYFDFSHSQAGAVYGGLNHPLYYELNKGERNELKFINPKQYIYHIARGFGGLSYADVVESGAVSQEKVKKYAQDMKNGDEFPIGWYNPDTGGQEGRHRALAALSLGCEAIPVVVITTVSRDEAIELATSYKDFSKEYLDDVYKHKGYHGISDLDWRTLRAYVEHRI
jgi:hypothetical protein